MQLFRRAAAGSALRALLLLLLLPAWAAAQQVVPLGPGTAGLAGRMEILSDPTGEATLSDVTSVPLSGQFIPAADTLPKEADVFWTRVMLQNPARRAGVWYLTSIQWDRAEMYYPRESGVPVQRAGHSLRPSERSVSFGMYPEILFRVELSAGESRLVYFRWERSRARFGLPPGNYVSRLLLDADRDDAIGDGMVRRRMLEGLHIGLMLMAAFYAVGHFRVVRDRAYLAFAGFLLSFSLLLTISSGAALDLFWPWAPEWDRMSGFYLVIPLLNVTWILFTREYLRTRETLPRMDRALIAIAWMLPPSFWFGHLLPAPTAFALSIGALLLTLASAVLLHRQPAGRSFLLANGAFAVTLATGLLIGAGILPPLFDPTHATRFGSLVQMALFATGLSQRVRVLQHEKERAETLAFTTHRLTRYFPRQLVQRILAAEEGSALRTERRQITLLFSDLTGFIELTDRLAPERVSEILNQYLREMLALIDRHGGTLDKVMGDGIMTFFGAPDEMPPEEQARRAVALAVDMQRRLAGLGEEWLRDGIDHDVRARIGIHQDFATVGNFGSETLMSYTAIGGAVNLASRLEGRCEPGKVLVSFPIYSRVRDEYPFEPVTEMLLKGFSRPHRVAALDPSLLPAAAGIR